MALEVMPEVPDSLATRRVVAAPEYRASVRVIPDSLTIPGGAK